MRPHSSTLPFGLLLLLAAGGVARAQSIGGIAPDSAMAGDAIEATLEVSGLTGVVSVEISDFVDSFVDGTDGSGDGSLDLSLSIPEATPAGSHDVAVTWDGGTLVAPGLFMVIEAPASVDDLSPSEVRRGVPTTVYVQGTGLDAFTGVALSSADVGVSRFAVVSPSLIRFVVTPGDRSVAGARDVTLQGPEPLVLASSIEVIRGPVELLRLTPSESERGDELTVSITGRNLDGVTAVSFGEGIESGTLAVTSPTAGTVEITVDAAAFSGPRDVGVSDGVSTATLFDGFTVLGGFPDVTSTEPPSATRGTTQVLTLRGENLEAVDDFGFGSRVTVLSVEVTDPRTAVAEIDVRDDAPTGPRPITLRVGDETADSSASFLVQAGTLDVFSIRPDRLSQGSTATLTIDGANLDGVDRIDAGSGIVIDSIDAESPVTITVDVTAERSAPIGFRDVTVSSDLGTVTLRDALVVTELVVPEPDLGFPEVVDFRRIQVGAISRVSVLVENLGELDETVRIADPIGDIDLFTLLDDSGAPVEEVSLDIPARESRTFRVQFAPSFESTNGAAWTLLAREETEVGLLSVRGTGVVQQLFFRPEPPADLGTYFAGGERVLPRINTELDNGAAPRSVIIEDVLVELSLNGVPLEDASEVLAATLTSAASDGVLYWGPTEIDWQILPEIGLYTGRLLVVTDADSAPLVPYEFSLLATRDPDAEPEDTADPGAESEDVADAGGETGAEGEPGDGGVDAEAGSPDALPDATSDGAGQDATAADSGDGDGDGDGDGGGDGGCCSAARGRGPGHASGWIALVVLALARRRAPAVRVVRA